MKTQVKICGLSSEEAVRTALDGGASHVGFIFFAKSPRNVSPEAAGALAATARGRATIVAVSVDAGDAELDAIVKGLRPDMLQLHGHESPERVGALKARYGLPVMKAISVREAADIEAARAYFPIADRMLFDAKPPKGAELPGGNGIPFDWRLVAALDADVDYMLSGGLTVDNAGEAMRLTGARALDVSSGVESAPGVKDPELIARFLHKVLEGEGRDAAARPERQRSLP